MKLSVYTDAGARGNPGPAAIAVLFFKDGKLSMKHGEYVGAVTNNQAEYMAVIKALEIAASMGAKELEMFTDSELVCRQMKGTYKVKDVKLKPLHGRAKELEKGFEKVTWGSVPRENPNIRRADGLVNWVLDNKKSEGGTTG